MMITDIGYKTRWIVRKEISGGVLFDRLTRSYGILTDNQFKMISVGKDVGEVQLDCPTYILDDCHVFKGLEKEAYPQDITIVENEKLPKDILSAPNWVYLELSRDCNLNCIHCYNGNNPQMPLDKQTIFRLLKEMVTAGVFEFRLTGGEPTMSPIFASVVERARELGLVISLNTNGCFDLNMRRLIVDLGIDEVILSIDGRESTHDRIRGKGSWKKTIETASFLASNNRRFRFNMTVMKINRGDVEYLAELGNQFTTAISYIPIKPSGKNKLRKLMLTAGEIQDLVEEISILRRKFPNIILFTYYDVLSEYPRPPHAKGFYTYNCAAYRNLSLDISGTVYSCLLFEPFGKQLAGGNIKENSLLNLWLNDNALWRFRNSGRSACRPCSYYGKSCDGGCSAVAYSETGEIDGIDPYCFVSTR